MCIVNNMNSLVKSKTRFVQTDCATRGTIIEMLSTTIGAGSIRTVYPKS